MSFRTNKTNQVYPVIGQKWTKPVPFTKENIAKVPDKTGVYIFYDKPQAKPIYVGVSMNGVHSGLRHRIQSYSEKDDFQEHPTKAKLRPHIHSFRYRITTESGARELEAKLKQGTKYNADNLQNEAKKGSVNAKEKLEKMKK